MVEWFEENQKKTKLFLGDGLLSRLKDGRMVCLKCVDHKQGKPNEVYDCKNTFYKQNGKNQPCAGQCCCWSEVHGKRSKITW